MNYLGIDIGTSGTKAVCFNELGQVLASASSEYEIISKNALYAEQRPLDWWNATKKVISKITKLGLTISGIGLSGQMHGLVLLDEEDNILRDSIIWCDNRAVKQTKELKDKLGTVVKKYTGNEPVSSFTLAKLLWVKQNEPHIFAKISKIMLPKDYIRYCLTKQFKTEYSDASGMQLLDIQNKCYAKEILDYLDIQKEMLPELIESVDISGKVLEEVSKSLKLPSNCFVVGGAGDQAAAALGSGILKKGDVSIVLGSSGVVFSPILKEDLKNNTLQVFMHAVPNTYHIMGVTNGCGLSYKWWKEQIAIKSYDVLNDDASNVPPLAHGIMYLPYLNGERTPIMDPYASGTWIGIRQNTTIKDMTRALLEGVAYSLKDCFTLLPKNQYSISISGGGAKSLLWRTIISSTLQSPIRRIKQSEGGALGVAMLAMVANKEYASIEEAVHAIIETEDVVQPNLVWQHAYENGFTLYKEAYNSLKKYYQMAYEKGGK